MSLARAILLAAVLTAVGLAPAALATELHPPIRLLDSDGRPVIESGAPVSPMATCDECHDTSYIAKHNYHANLDFSKAQDTPADDAKWRHTGNGLYHSWDPLTYALPPQEPDGNNPAVADWIREQGWRHVGGGPASAAAGLDSAWDWQRSGVVELNCFICHIGQPANQARIAELKAGRFKWAATATLAHTGVVDHQGEQWAYNAEIIDEAGYLDQSWLDIVAPTAVHCGQCHAPVYYGQAPLYVVPDPSLREIETTGQIFSPQRPALSGMNLKDKGQLNEPWDLHAERLLSCTSCHFSLNNPSYFNRAEHARLSHLRFDARVLDISEYLRTPNHEFAKGYSATTTVADHLDGSMRSCDDCHDPHEAHSWLPYKQRHFSALACQACHIAAVEAPARMMTDWTVLAAPGQAQAAYRGVAGPVDDPGSLISGFEPVLLARDTGGETSRFTPHNIISTWFWISDPTNQPVPLAKLEEALFVNGEYHPSIVAALDNNRDGMVAESELRLDTQEKVNAVAARLVATGVSNPRIAAEVQAYGLHHNVTSDRFATKDCRSCHSARSRFAQRFTLASYVPGGVVPAAVSGRYLSASGSISMQDDGALLYQPDPLSQRVYVLGYSKWPIVDLIGLLGFGLVFIAIAAHAALRITVRHKQRRSG